MNEKLSRFSKTAGPGILFASTAIAVLYKKKGYEEKFLEEFNKITKEGFQLVLMEPFKALDAGPIDIQMGNFYYFQHKSCIR